MAKTAKDFIAEAKARITEIPPAEAKARLEQSGVAIDVREPDELETGRLPGAVNIPRGMIEYKIGKVPGTEDPEVPMVVYCKGGGRGAMATRTLVEMGYVNATSLDGGLDAWVDAGYEVERQPVEGDNASPGSR